ncbi:MAG: hypothetical protein M9928_02570 [Anaerolineae bacterium]|nr:hypothetical protein [Anaerolineae bacterium]MCO5203890.1 hypothetical protein [Anaerolineae bacterium]
MKTRDAVFPALAALLNGLIDYAGLFPPANLALEPAVANYASYRRGADHWMLARFILPANRLLELDEAILSSFSAEIPLHLSLLTSDLQIDGAQIGRFLTEHKERVTVDIIESRLPATGSCAAFIADNATVLQQLGLSARIFYELPFDANWDTRLPEVITKLAEHNQATGDNSGFKLRCGGIASPMVPSPAQVARAITRCRDADVMLKCTAGLHHPFRHYSDDIDAMMHGFVNVFGGGMLAAVHGLDSAELTAIIAEQDTEAFTFSAETFSWRNLSADAAQIAALRQSRLLSFGSCSFDEPRADLQMLGLLPIHN